MLRYPFGGAPSSLSFPLFIIVEKTQLRSAKQWQFVTRLINKNETTVMVSGLIPHRSSNIHCVRISVRPLSILQRVRIPVRLPLILLLCSHSRPSSVRLLLIPRIILLLTSFLVPSLIVGYRSTVTDASRVRFKWWTNNKNSYGLPMLNKSILNS